MATTLNPPHPPPVVKLTLVTEKVTFGVLVTVAVAGVVVTLGVEVSVFWDLIST